jgi:hypothetical protein
MPVRRHPSHSNEVSQSQLEEAQSRLVSAGIQVLEETHRFEGREFHEGVPNSGTHRVAKAM